MDRKPKSIDDAASYVTLGRQMRVVSGVQCEGFLQEHLNRLNKLVHTKFGCFTSPGGWTVLLNFLFSDRGERSP